MTQPEAAAWRLECYEELTSTSDICLERARAGEAPGLALLAHHQTKGRGSRGRAWANAGQSLAFSVLLDAGQAGADALGGWPFVASLAFFEGLAESVPAARKHLMIKWPNDILLDGQKLAGILIEREGTMLVIGMGANLAQPPQEAQIGRKAGALGDYGPVPSSADVARAILAHLTNWCDVWNREGFAALCAEWRKRAHPVGTPLVVSGGTTYEKGQFAGLAADGRLLLETEDGMKTIATGDILLAQHGADVASRH
ncbi:biotin--[acetyl-CoA-carboxylase] ligase [Acetobacter farinalis]|uniref:biotin--[biotin carboxyl-carrier protein] ligase n=1 Tax=Acetobacter farinalis TaxID=1260984 RepID=A0ABT3Q651_9PROT|nr:biotin--[acetyl-CoA-carboxylase] ligase [Acetobacter farinalis]MCX2560767.1 biotin--[acetyl-CoA-carboxylase] ligase [Acetobacter farinalis]NHO29418.1 biotin--[acetyl-CoA-carboxylase] ligase [Acetobacter farinalis]